MLSQAPNSLHTNLKNSLAPSPFYLSPTPRSKWPRTVNCLLSVKVKPFSLVASHIGSGRSLLYANLFPSCSSSFYFSVFPMSAPYWSCVLLKGLCLQLQSYICAILPHRGPHQHTKAFISATWRPFLSYLTPSVSRSTTVDVNISCSAYRAARSLSVPPSKLHMPLQVLSWYLTVTYFLIMKSKFKFLILCLNNEGLISTELHKCYRLLVKYLIL